MTPSESVQSVEGQPVNDDDLDWIKHWRELRRESPRVLDDAAKQVMLVSSGMATLYVSLFAALKLTNNAPSLGHWEQLFLFSPVAAWMLCTIVCLLGFLPAKYNAYADAPADIRAAYKQLVQHKRCVLYLSTALLVSAVVLACMVVALVPHQSQSATGAAGATSGEFHPTHKTWLERRY